MTFITPVQRLVYRFLLGALEMRWSHALGIALLHAAVTALGFLLIGEEELVSGVTQFVYFYTVTGSSVGYGDFSPVSDAGKLFAAIWVIPGAISLFAFLLGKAVASLTQVMRNIMNGLGDFSDKTGHVVVVGHVPGQTELLLEEARRLHGRQDIVIVSTEDIPGLKSEWRFIRATSLSQRADLERAGVAGAAYIVVLGRDDDESLAAAMAVGALKPRGHVVAYFREPGPADLIESYCPDVETVTSISVQMVARALVDPGAGSVMMALASTKTGATLYSLTLDCPGGATVARLRTELSERGASLIGYLPEGTDIPEMVLTPDMVIEAGRPLYYIARERLGDALTLAPEARAA